MSLLKKKAGGGKLAPPRAAFILTIALGLLSSSVATANPPPSGVTTVTVTADDCDCESFRGLSRIGSLASDVSTIGIQSVDSAGRAFHREQEQRQMLELRLQAHDLIPTRCRNALGMGSIAANPDYDRLTIYNRWGMGQQQDPYLRSAEDPDRIMAGYRSLIDQVALDCTPANAVYNAMSQDERDAYSACLREKAPGAYNEFATGFNGSSDTDIMAQLHGLGYAGITISDIQVMRAYHLALNAGSESASLTALRGYRGRLSVDQNNALILMVGKRRRESYDRARNSAGMSAQGVVDYGAGLSTDLANEMFRFRGDRNGATMSAADFAGICRDIASHQGQVAEALGMRNCYVVSFGRSNPSYHVTLTCQHPTEYSKVYNYDYGNLHEPQAGNSSMLFQGISDHTLVYRVCKPGGRCVATVDSDFRRFIDEAAGFDIQTLDPLARARSSMHAANLALSRDGGTAVRVGAGDDGRGQHLFFGANHSWGGTGPFHGQVGGTVGVSTRSEDRYPGQSPLTASYLYLRADQHLSPSWQPSDRLRLTWDNRISVAAAITSHQQDGSDNNGEINGHGDGRLATGVRADWQPTDATRVIARVEAQGSPSILDIRDNSMQAPILALDHVMGSVEVRHQMSDILLAAEATVVGNELGTRARAQIGVFGDHVGATAGYEGRLGENTAPFLEGSARSIFGNVFVQPNRHVRTQFQLQHDFDVPVGGTSGFVMGELQF